MNGRKKAQKAQKRFSGSCAFRAFLRLLVSVLTVTDLKKAFVSPEGERVDIVDVASFELAAGAQMALRGESGSGKTTFLNLIAGILAADSGRVALDGAEMTALSAARRDRLRAEKLGYIFQ